MVVKGSFGRILILVLEGVARRRQFRNDRFVSGLLEPRPGDGQLIPFVFDDVLLYWERLISEKLYVGDCDRLCTLM